ncbi:MAG: hypothetical protein QMC67_00920 [Candidatus Wallbacteria bacterium]
MFNKIGELLNKIPFKMRKWLVGIFGVFLFGGAIVLIFLYFYLTSRLSYPERNVLYRINENVTNYASSTQYHPDRLSIASISEGTVGAGYDDSSAGKHQLKAIIATSKRRETGVVDEYELLNTSYQRIATANTKSEKSRSFFDVSRSNYIENVASFVNPASNTEEVKIITLEKAHEIASSVDADTYVMEGGKPVHKYRLTDGRRYMGLFGDRFRFSTKLFEAANGNNFKQIYGSRESGLFGLMPQGSNYSFFKDPETFFETVSGYFSDNSQKSTSEVYNFKITQFWDTFPWRTLNGGYKIIDKTGELAMIKIEDFWFNYDNDVVYWYYLDKDGSGVIDEKNECVGKVLFSVMSKADDARAGGGKENKDISYTVNYSFMAGSNVSTAAADFILCGDIEVMMPDQIFDGFGQHSYLGYVEEKRDDIMLYLDRSVENLDRTIKEDDTLGSKKSIVRLLKAASRKYSPEIAAKFEIN